MTDSNSPCGFWHLPTELRRAFYDHLDHSRVIHVSQRNRRAVLYDCATTSISNDDDGRERYPLPHCYHPLWVPLVDGQTGSNQACLKRLMIRQRITTLPRPPAPAARWALVWPSIASLESIIKVKIEIDHTDPGSWSLANERAILAPIKLMCSAVPCLATTVILPKLHPRYENPSRHFAGGDSKPFTILRRIRQKFHYQNRPYGGWQIACSRCATFPLAVDLVVWRAEIIWMFGQPPANITPEEREAFVQEELDKWKQGVDVAAWADELNRDVPDEMLCG